MVVLGEGERWSLDGSASRSEGAFMTITTFMTITFIRRIEGERIESFLGSLIDLRVHSIVVTVTTWMRFVRAVMS